MQQRFWWLSVGSVVSVALVFAPLTVLSDDLFEETLGPVGTTDDPNADTGGAAAIQADEFPGPLGRVDEHAPHPECPTCFTVPGVNAYQIFERVVTDEKTVLLPRMVPNPAPLAEGEVRPTVDEETGEQVWYIGRQAYVGPTDDDYWSAGAPLSTIALKRIQMRHVDDILGIEGVHGFGIGPSGFVVQLAPESSDQAESVPLMIENVPVEIQVTERETFQNHLSQRFRPIPAGAGIAVRVPAPGGGYETGGGTLGPHVVRDTPHVTSCCRIWSLTAAHVVQYELSDPSPSPASRLVYQPYSKPPSAANFIGSVAYAFSLTQCASEVHCESPAAVTNWTHVNPDIAAIDMGHFSYPSNTPVGTDPTRRLQKSGTANDYINGPSGRIQEAWYGHRHKIWGALSQYQTVYVIGINHCSTIENDNTEALYRICGLNRVGFGVYSGDSGSLVAYEGTGDRHVAGVLIAGSSLAASYVPASDIKTAFDNANKDFSHFWGTKSSFRRPASKTCDDPGC